jgi:hypothetical protein
MNMVKVVRLVAVSTPDAHGFGWKWQSADGEHKSREVFTYFHDCMEDARRKGYEVDLWKAKGQTAPGHEGGRGMT